MTNADEATTGIMALTILRGNLPLMLPGQAYSGTLEAYALAPFYALFGTSNLALNSSTSSSGSGRCRLLLPCPAGPHPVRGDGRGSPRVGTRPRPHPALDVGVPRLRETGSWPTSPRSIAWAEWPGRPAHRGLVGRLPASSPVWPIRLHPMFVCLVAPAIVVVTWRHRHALLRWLGPALVGVVVGMAPFLGYNPPTAGPSLHQPPSAVGDVSYVDRLQAFGGTLARWPSGSAASRPSARSSPGREVRVHHRHRGGVCRARAALAARLGRARCWSCPGRRRLSCSPCWTPSRTTWTAGMASTSSRSSP